MAQQGLVDRLAAVRQCLDRAFEVDRVPAHGGGNDEVEPTRTIALVLEAAMADHAEAVEKDSARGRRWSRSRFRATLLAAARAS
jgi:hypothetical protein